jgi:UTP-glucose-1-phosphate uridylyltransferase
MPSGAGGDMQLTDGIAALICEQQVLAYRYTGVRYDCGSKLGLSAGNRAVQHEASRRRQRVLRIPVITECGEC